jgi:hypothetical protein
MVSGRSQECICRPSSGKNPRGDQQGEKTEGVFPLLLSLPVVFGLLIQYCTPAWRLQLCLCGLCDAGRQEGRHHDVRVSFRRTSPLNQGWCVGIFVFSVSHVRHVEARAQATVLKVAPRSPECHLTARGLLEGGPRPSLRKKSLHHKNSHRHRRFSLAISDSRRPWIRSGASWKPIASRRREMLPPPSPPTTMKPTTHGYERSVWGRSRIAACARGQ